MSGTTQDGSGEYPRIFKIQDPSSFSETPGVAPQGSPEWTPLPPDSFPTLSTSLPKQDSKHGGPSSRLSLLQRQQKAAARLLRNQLPYLGPILDEWDFAGWSQVRDGVGGDFYDWFTLPEGRVGIALGDILDRGLEAALAACGVRSSVRAHAEYADEPEEVVRRTSMTLWSGSAGDQYGSLFFGFLDPFSGRLHYSAPGRPSLLRLNRRGRSARLNTQEDRMIGCEADSMFEAESVTLAPRERLLLASDGVRNARNSVGNRFGEARLIELLEEGSHDTARDLLARIRWRLEAHCDAPLRDDMAMMVVARRK
jgi:phosphoserine phosphatase RsbU/P